MVFPTKSVDNYILMENTVPEISNITVLFWISTLETNQMCVFNYFVTAHGKMAEFRILVKRAEVMVGVLSSFL